MEIKYEDVCLNFETNEKVFSPNNLDQGTKAMLDTAEIKNGDAILDLGCGFGFIGIYFSKKNPDSKILMVDISKNAVELSKINAKKNDSKIEIFQSDGFDKIKDQRFDVILSNPPYHVDFSVPKAFIEEGVKSLNLNGKFYMVTKRRKWYENKIRSTFGYVKVIEKDGYFVFYSEKRQLDLNKKLAKNKGKLSKNLQNKYGAKKQD